MRVLAALVATVAVAAGACTKELPAKASPDDVVEQAGTLGEVVDYFDVDGTMLDMEVFDQSADGFRGCG